ncbi:MAG: peptidoglycan DD-metalloendopeptidase family protein [Candidatus Rokubacteria bacterium]|nr:peptidoglycan DD-metalloendopeptidase family protein [Candidatus Rokubacteria bacterium]
MAPGDRTLRRILRAVRGVRILIATARRSTRRLTIIATSLVILVPALAPAQKPNPDARSGPAAGAGVPQGRVPAPSVIHEVRAGDTLGAIAKRYGVTVAAIVSANGLTGPNAKLKIGQRLVIPAAVATTTATAAPRMSASARKALVTALRAPATLILALPDFTDLIPLLQWPIDGTITSSFGRRRTGWHTGIDIKADLGMPVAASAPGVVTASGWEGRYGRVVKVEHVNGFITVYAHNQHNYVEVGERVSGGQVIAVIGRTGRATTNHLHFEVRHGGLAYNPLYVLPLPPRVGQVDETDDEDPDVHDP